MNLPDCIFRYISSYLDIHHLINFSNCSKYVNSAVLSTNFLHKLLYNRYQIDNKYNYNIKLYNDAKLTLHLQMIYQKEKQFLYQVAKYYEDLFIKKDAKNIFEYRLCDIPEYETRSPMIQYDTEIYQNLLSNIDSIQCIIAMLTLDYKNDCKKILMNKI